MTKYVTEFDRETARRRRAFYEAHNAKLRSFETVMKEPRDPPLHGNNYDEREGGEAK